MTAALAPATEDEIAAAVRDASAAREALAVDGGGSRAGLGHPVRATRALTTRGLTGITLYEPAELVLSARAGTPLAEVEGLLRQNGQRLAFEPMDHRPLYGSTGEPTIGGVAAANVSGPRRILSGAARDSLIGVRAVTGRGDAIKSGGRVMKNVTGYDLVRFLAGSLGTLGVLTEVTFKVLPATETEATLLMRCLDDKTAIAALSAALGSPFEVSGAAHRPGEGGGAETWMRIEGFTKSVHYRAGCLRDELHARFGNVEIVNDAAASRTIWSAVRDLDALGAPPGATVWRISVKPGDGPAVADSIRRAFAVRILYDWGGGLIWIAGGEGEDAGASIVRAAVKAVGGHATLVRASEEIRRRVPVFEPQATPLMELTRKLKHAFDPAGILNPGRMYGDM
jgi:glycolate oxidase FAD binding subunit